MSNENAGKQWTDEDTTKLKKLAKENTPTGLIAWQLGRSETAIYAKASELKINLKPVNQSPYDRNVANQKKKGK